MANLTTRRMQLTWVERGTNNAACLGLDEVIEVTAERGEGLIAATLQAESDAEYHAECQGVDLEKYEVISDLLDD